MFFDSALRPFRLAAVVNDTEQELNALSDWQLKDIGVNRDQLGDIALDLAARRTGAPTRRGLARRAMSLTPLFRAFVSS